MNLVSSGILTVKPRCFMSLRTILLLVWRSYNVSQQEDLVNMSGYHAQTLVFSGST